jgi:hypothetical protein
MFLSQASTRHKQGCKRNWLHKWQQADLPKAWHHNKKPGRPQMTAGQSAKSMAYDSESQEWPQMAAGQKGASKAS